MIKLRAEYCEASLLKTSKLLSHEKHLLELKALLSAGQGCHFLLRVGSDRPAIFDAASQSQPWLSFWGGTIIPLPLSETMPCSWGELRAPRRQLSCRSCVRRCCCCLHYPSVKTRPKSRSWAGWLNNSSPPPHPPPPQWLWLVSVQILLIILCTPQAGAQGLMVFRKKKICSLCLHCNMSCAVILSAAAGPEHRASSPPSSCLFFPLHRACQLQSMMLGGGEAPPCCKLKISCSDMKANLLLSEI